jgi:hypothetical protein
MCVLSKNEKGLIFMLFLILSVKLGVAQKKYDMAPYLHFSKSGFPIIPSQRKLFSSPVSANHQAMQLGFMCKKEWEVEKKTGMPIRLRLGSLSYCDWLEGKPNAIRFNY